MGWGYELNAFFGVPQTQTELFPRLIECLRGRLPHIQLRLRGSLLDPDRKRSPGQPIDVEEVEENRRRLERTWSPGVPVDWENVATVWLDNGGDDVLHVYLWDPRWLDAEFKDFFPRWDDEGRETEPTAEEKVAKRATALWLVRTLITQLGARLVLMMGHTEGWDVMPGEGHRGAIDQALDDPMRLRPMLDSLNYWLLACPASDAAVHQAIDPPPRGFAAMDAGPGVYLVENTEHPPLFLL